MNNPFKKVLVLKSYGVGIEIRKEDIPTTPVYEPTPQMARKLLLDYFPDWETQEVKHSKEVLQLAYTSPDGAKKIYGEHW